MAVRDKIKIMVVDDMATSRGIVVSTLESMGIQNIAATNTGEDALKAIQTSPVHLVVCDYNMPKMNGLALLHALRKSEKTKKVGFIMITGSEDPNVIQKGAALGMNNYLKKPITPQSLRAAIEKVVGRI